MRQGNTLSVGWALPTDKGVVMGVNVYKVVPGKALQGRWAAIPGNGQLQNETMAFLKAMDEDE